MSPGEEASFSISVYSEHPFEFASFEGAGEFPLCTTCQSLCPQVRPNLCRPSSLPLPLPLPNAAHTAVVHERAAS